MLAPPVFLRRLFDAALGASSPEDCVPQALPQPPAGRTLVLGAGKAAASMARCVEEHWHGRIEGLVVTRYGHGLDCQSIEVVEASHPVPDGAGREAARRMLSMASGLSKDDLALCLISGGGSALLAEPAAGLRLDEKIELTRALLKCGASIDEINAVRKHLSAIKGGRLAEACHPARVVTLAISDVPGDLASVIASGPTVPDPSTFSDARAVLNKYEISAPSAVECHLRECAEETPKPGDRAFANDDFRMIATPQDALDAAASYAVAMGVTPLVLGDRIEGEARDVAKVFGAIALQIRHRSQPITAPCVILSGGETTVTVSGSGRGGRNTEFLLALSLALKGEEHIWALACDTDGIDGVEDNAGAIIFPDTLERARQRGIDPIAELADNNAYVVFENILDLVMTGPTRTNVNDFRAIFIGASQPDAAPGTHL